MKLYEYQAKKVFASFGLPVPEGEAAGTPQEVEEIARRIGGRVVIKAQVHVGGRGKAGGIKLADDPKAARDIAQTMLGSTLKGFVVKQVLVEQALPIDKEYYLSFTLDRDSQQIIGICSAMGGVDVEEVAENHPDKLVRLHVDIAFGLLDFQVRDFIRAAGLDPAKSREISAVMKKLYDLCVQTDASLAEINPLVVTHDGRVVVADAKFDVDDNALFRQKNLEVYKDASEEDELEAEAHRRNLTYVHLGGSIGIIGNGAGLVMNTLDIVTQAGGKPANFLDIGGGARADVVRNALDMVLLDKEVKAILINIFGGITRGDEVAKGILEATSTLNVRVPIVVRMAGTAAEEGLKLLEGSRLVPAATAVEGARKAVELAGENGLMSILVDKSTKLLVQGITGREGAFHTGEMRAFGTNIVAGVTPGKGGGEHDGIPLFDSVAEAIAKTGANASISFVPPPFAADGILEAVAAGMPLVVCITEGIPILDMVRVARYTKGSDTRLIGPNCPGITTVTSECKLGIMPNMLFKAGSVGLISRSGTLTYEVVDMLTHAGVGQTTCIGIGGDPIIGTKHLDALQLFEKDAETRVTVMIGEIGGSDEEMAAEFLKHSTMKVVGFISGRNAPPGKRMGHAGAIISGNTGTAAGKIAALERAGVPVAGTLEDIVPLVQKALSK